MSIHVCVHYVHRLTAYLSLVAQVAGKIYFAPSKYFRNGYLAAQDLVDATFKIFDTSHKINSLSFGDKYPVRSPVSTDFCKY